MSKKTYFVQGMHCAACEVLLESDIAKLKGVEKVDAVLAHNCVEVRVANNQKLPSIEDLNSMFKDLGYTFHDKKAVEPKLNKQDIGKVVGVFSLFIVAFYLLGNTGVLLKASVSPNSSPFSYFVFGLLAGLSSCAALVGGVLLSLSSRWNKLYNANTVQSIKPFLYFNVSRIIAFGALGAVLGLIGSTFKISITLTSLLTVSVSLVMLALGLQMVGVGWFKKFSLNLTKGLAKNLNDDTKFTGKYMPTAVGALTFFVPCGFTLIAQTNALASGSPSQAALSMLAFSLGTLPVLALISFTSVRLHSNLSFTKKFNLFAGLLVSFFALYTLNSQLNVLGLPSLNNIGSSFDKTAPIAAAFTGDLQLIQIEASGFEYFPRKFNIKSGIRTQLDIYNSGVYGCAQAAYAKGLYADVIYLKPGLNSVEFTPTKPGTYKISCTMGMVPPVTVNVYP